MAFSSIATGIFGLDQFLDHQQNTNGCERVFCSATLGAKLSDSSLKINLRWSISFWEA